MSDPPFIPQIGFHSSQQSQGLYNLCSAQRAHRSLEGATNFIIIIIPPSHDNFLPFAPLMATVALLVSNIGSKDNVQQEKHKISHGGMAGNWVRTVVCVLGGEYSFPVSHLPCQNHSLPKLLFNHSSKKDWYSYCTCLFPPLGLAAALGQGDFDKQRVAAGQNWLMPPSIASRPWFNLWHTMACLEALNRLGDPGTGLLHS